MDWRCGRGGATGNALWLWADLAVEVLVEGWRLNGAAYGNNSGAW